MKNAPRLWLVVCVLAIGCADYHSARQAKKDGDHAAALSHFTELAEFGHAPSQLELGRMVLRGEGTEKSVPRALGLLEAAAAQNDARAHFELARLYQRGRDVPQDTTLAMKHYHQSALGFYARAALKLAPLVAQNGRLPAMDDAIPQDVYVLALYYAAMIDRREVPAAALSAAESKLSPEQKSQSLSLAKTRYSKPKSVLPSYFLTH